MARLTLGGGWGSTAAHGTEDPDLSGSDDGPSLTASLDLGASAEENLVLHARIAVLHVRSSADGESSFGWDPILVTTYGPLVGVTYYVMPLNLYLTGALGAAWVFAQTLPADHDPEGPGVCLHVDAGKEWWIAGDWGIGVAARLWYVHDAITHSSQDETWRIVAVTALATLTAQ